MKKELTLTAILTLAVLAGLSVTSFASWEYPSMGPSFGNPVAPPVNTGPTSQTKHGTLKLTNGGQIIDSNTAASNTGWQTPSQYDVAVDTDGPLDIHGALSTSDISSSGFMSKALISTDPLVPTERPLCANKTTGKIVPC